MVQNVHRYHVTFVEMSPFSPMLSMNTFAPHTNGPTRRAPPADRANIATQPVPRLKIEQHEACPASVRGNGTPAPRNRETPVLKAEKLWKMWIATNLPTKLVESHSLRASIQHIYSYFRIKVFCDMSPLRHSDTHSVFTNISQISKSTGHLYI